MNDLQDRLDGIQRWFYGGEPGIDDLPQDEEEASALPPSEDAPAGQCQCSLCARRALLRR